MARPLKGFGVSGARISTWTERAVFGPLAAIASATWAGRGGWRRNLRLLPDGCVDLVWDGERLAACIPAGEAIWRQVGPQSCNVGLRLRCGAGGAIVGRPLAPAGAQALLAETWGELASHGEARLRAAAGDPDRQRRILEELVGLRLADGARPEAEILALAARLSQALASPVESVARAVGLEPRSLRRRFANEVGLGPKRLQRVLRFNALLGRLAASESLAGLAAEHGYADQAHMTRECRALCGSTPRRLAEVLEA
jgi:AraC-like DNA-binding protein